MEQISIKKTGLGRAQPRPRRSDGQITREQLLNTAGLVFAECGYDKTTSKLICERANANSAAVNYHFGSKDGLYEAVLAEAHRHLIDADELRSWAEGSGDARIRLRRVLGHLLVFATQKSGWAFPVLLRELLNPSPLMPTLARKIVRPKVQILIDLMADIMALPPEHPALQRCVFMCIVPCILMAVAPPAMKSDVLPSLLEDVDAFVSDLLTFALAGIAAVAAQAKSAKL